MFVTAFMLGIATATLFFARRDLVRAGAFAAVGILSFFVSGPALLTSPSAASLCAAQERVDQEPTTPAAGQALDDGPSDRDAATPNSPAPLSVAPLVSDPFPDRDGSAPEWLESGPEWKDGRVYQVSVRSKPQLELIKCEEALRTQMQVAVQEYIAGLLESGRAARILGYRPGTEELEGLVTDRF